MRDTEMFQEQWRVWHDWHGGDKVEQVVWHPASKGFACHWDYGALAFVLFLLTKL